MNNWFKYANGMVNLDNVWKISKGQNKDGKFFVTFHCVDKETVSFSFDTELKMNEYYEKILKNYSTADVIDKIAEKLNDIENKFEGIIHNGQIECEVRYDYTDEHMTGIENNLEWTQKSLSQIDDKLKDINESINSIKQNNN